MPRSSDAECCSFIQRRSPGWDRRYEEYPKRNVKVDKTWMEMYASCCLYVAHGCAFAHNTISEVSTMTLEFSPLLCTSFTFYHATKRFLDQNSHIRLRALKVVSQRTQD